MGGPAPLVPAGGAGAAGTVRNPVMVLVIGMCCFLYMYYVLWTQLNELKAFRRKDDINPIMVFVPVLGLLLMWQLPEKVLEAKRMAGIQNPQVAHPITYLLLAGYFFTMDLNEVFEAAARQQGGPPPVQARF